MTTETYIDTTGNMKMLKDIRNQALDEFVEKIKEEYTKFWDRGNVLSPNELKIMLNKIQEKGREMKE